MTEIEWNKITPQEYEKFINFGAAVTPKTVTNDNIVYAIIYLKSKEKTGDEIIKSISKCADKLEMTIEETYQLYEDTIAGITTYNSINNPVIVNIQKEQEIPENIMKEAKDIYYSGKFIDYILTSWNKVWYKDTQVIRFISLISASNYVINAEDGLHTYISGDSGIGKSDSVKQTFKFLLKNFYLASKFTTHWIFYGSKNGTLHEKQILLNDDTTFDGEQAAIMRNMLSGWMDGVTRERVSEGGEPETLRVPPRVTLILTSVDGISKKDSEGQDESRYTTIQLNRSKQEEKEIKLFMQEPKKDISHELEVIHAIWSLMKDTEITLPNRYDTIPIYKHMFGNIEKNLTDHDLTFRELKKYRTMLMANALLHGRKNVTEEDEKEINEIMSHCIMMIKNTIRGLSKNESIILEYLEKTNESKTSAEISKEVNIPNVYDAIRGKAGSFTSPTGGLMKIYPIEVTRDVDGKTRLKLLKYESKQKINNRTDKSNEEIPIIF